MTTYRRHLKEVFTALPWIRQVHFKIIAGGSTYGCYHLNTQRMQVGTVADPTSVDPDWSPIFSLFPKDTRGISGHYIYEFLCGRAQEVCNLGVNRSGSEAMGLLMDLAMDLSMP